MPISSRGLLLDLRRGYIFIAVIPQLLILVLGLKKKKRSNPKQFQSTDSWVMNIFFLLSLSLSHNMVPYAQEIPFHSPVPPDSLLYYYNIIVP